MKTGWNEDNVANISIAIGIITSIIATIFFFFPGAGALGDMVRDKELNPFLGFIGFILVGFGGPIASFFASMFAFIVGAAQSEKILFARNRKLKQATEFIIQARGK